MIDFLKDEKSVKDMFKYIDEFLIRWLPEFQENNRTYMTVSIGCTGGQHRSVFMAEQLFAHYQNQYENVQLRHRELGE